MQVYLPPGTLTCWLTICSSSLGKTDQVSLCGSITLHAVTVIAEGLTLPSQSGLASHSVLSASPQCLAHRDERTRVSPGALDGAIGKAFSFHWSNQVYQTPTATGDILAILRGNPT